MDWLEDIIEHTLANYGGRKIVLWGKYEITEYLKETLGAVYGVEDICYIDSNEDRADYTEVFPVTLIDGRNKDMYIVVPLAVHDAIKKRLAASGYKSLTDYYYFSDCIVKMTDDYYEDSHGNKLIGKRDRVKFCFSGWNSTIVIGKGAKFDGILELYMHNEGLFELGEMADITGSSVRLGRNFKKVKIGKDVSLKNCQLEVCGEGSLLIGDSVVADAYACFQRIHVQTNASLSIGKGTSLCVGYNMVATEGTQIVIGEDCMFSWGVSFISNDGHTIFDLKSKRALNAARELGGRKIVIGDHVWIGMNSVVLYDTCVGKGSIIGAGSLVKGNYPNNCIAAGHIAKVIRKDVSWCRKDGAENIGECGAYTELTAEPNV